jgi:hypothetical protein
VCIKQFRKPDLQQSKALPSLAEKLSRTTQFKQQKIHLIRDFIPNSFARLRVEKCFSFTSGSGVWALVVDGGSIFALFPQASTEKYYIKSE